MAPYCQTVKASDFKVGDVVRCVSIARMAPPIILTRGKEYTVVDTSLSVVRVVADDKIFLSCYPWRFRKVSAK